MGTAKALLCIGVVAVLIAAASRAQEAVEDRALRIAIFDFEDEAGFQGKWELARDVPALLGKYLEREEAIAVVPRDSVEDVLGDKELKKFYGLTRDLQMGRRLGADLVITGIVEQFGVRRFTAGDPNFAGYKSYKSTIDLREIQLVRVATEEVIETVEVFRDSTERPLAMNLFGRPVKQDLEFRALFKVDFGSAPFFELAFGKLTDAAFKDLSAEIVQILINRPPIDLSGERAEVLAVEGDEVYLGIGNADGVEYGDLLPLLHLEEQVALVRVQEIIGSHLCKSWIVEKTGEVETGQRIGQRLSRNKLKDRTLRKKEQ